MRVVVQRVSRASVSASDGHFHSIGKGLMILVGVTHNDTTEDVEYLASKIVSLRIFDDEKGVMNLSVKDVDGELMVISQFTLHAKVKKGNRPSYIDAAKHELAVPMYEHLIKRLEDLTGKSVARGVFGAYMDIDMVNAGPVTILIDTHDLK